MEMKYDSIKLTDGEMYQCELLLSRVATINERLMQMDENALVKLIRYEATTRQRPVVLYRLTARFGKLRKNREWDELNEFIQNYNDKRKSYRKVS